MCTVDIQSSPAESKWARIRRKLNMPPPVQAAVVAGVFSILVLWGQSCTRASRLEGRVQVMQDRIAVLSTELDTKRSDIHSLETQLAPFRTIALDRFSGPDVEALAKLATQITELKVLDDLKTKKLDQIQIKLDATKEMVEKPQLLWRNAKEIYEGTNFVLRAYFQPTKNEPLGQLRFDIQLTGSTNAQIISVKPAEIGICNVWPDPHDISADGRMGKLVFDGISFFNPTIEITFTEKPQSFEIKSSHFGEGQSYEWKPKKGSSKK